MIDAFLELATANPWLAWALGWSIWVIPVTIAIPFQFFLSLRNRTLRHQNIRLHGWPKNPVMDADGDIIYPKTENE